MLKHLGYSRNEAFYTGSECGNVPIVAMYTVPTRGYSTGQTVTCPQRLHLDAIHP